jgi:hypothetical protein
LYVFWRKSFAAGYPEETEEVSLREAYEPLTVVDKLVQFLTVECGKRWKKGDVERLQSMSRIRRVGCDKDSVVERE